MPQGSGVAPSIGNEVERMDQASDQRGNPQHDPQLGVIGTAPRRVDALGKVTGRARFAADLAAPGMLWAEALLARRPHARIISLDTSRARTLPGVRAVLTAADIPGERTFGVVIRNQPVLAGTRVRSYGDGVALVVTESPEIAARALAAIEVTYEDLPAVFDPEEALRQGAPEVHAGGALEAPNLCTHHRVRKGDVAAGFAAAHLVLERTYRTQHVDHAYLEPEAALAEPAGDGGVRVTGSIQNIFSTRRSLAAVLKLDLAQVTVVQATLGGSFGGKDEVMTQMACRAALGALATGRPVKMVNSRERSLAESYKRHPYVLHYKAGVEADGRLTAIEARIVADAGAYASMSPFVTWRSAVQFTGPYACPNAAADVYAAYTNNVYTGAMRGFGAPQVNFAIESLMDEIAEQLGLDPLDLRRRNVFRQDDETATGQRLTGHVVSIREVLDRAAAAARWDEVRAEIERDRRAGATPTQPASGGWDRALSAGARRRGIGLACSYRGVSLGAEGVDSTGAIVSVQADGSVVVSLGLVDMGQGLASTMAMIAASVLGIDTGRVKVPSVHTGRVPDSGPTVASRSTVMGGQAVRKAAEAVRDVLVEVVAEELGVPAAGLEARGGRIADARGRGLGFAEAAACANARGRPLLGFGWHRAPATDWDPERGAGQAYFTFVYSANVAEVEVDEATGRVRVLRVTAAHDVGRAIHPAMVRSQICGGVAMGVGYALLENYELAAGIPATENLDTYLIPTALDAPEVETLIIENPDPAGPFGAKSIGEPATEITAAAILNAVAHATGRRITELPADLEMVRLGRHLQPPAPGHAASGHSASAAGSVTEGPS
jgi:CO/xanthine dehydrogenase Mo-binding subunit